MKSPAELRLIMAGKKTKKNRKKHLASNKVFCYNRGSLSVLRNHLSGDRWSTMYRKEVKGYGYLREKIVREDRNHLQEF